MDFVFAELMMMTCTFSLQGPEKSTLCSSANAAIRDSDRSKCDYCTDMHQDRSKKKVVLINIPMVRNVISTVHLK